ncbi:MAG: hypothetical protein ACHREM_22765, partial [Polyangiales bacterium]
LGLGVGALRSGRRALMMMWPRAIAAVIRAAIAASRVAITAESTGEHLWLLYFDLPMGSPTYPGVRAPIVAAFVLTAAAFVPLGQIVAERLARFRDASKPLQGYAYDLGGSLAGVVAFSVASFAGAFPIVWFAVVFGVGAIFFRVRRLQLAVYAVVALSCLAVVRKAEKAEIYSPYYALSKRVAPDSVSILTNGSLHQIALDLRRSTTSISPANADVRTGYHIPYRLLRERPKRVLVLGAGTGNDVAVALDEGVDEVHVVEIDPKILDLGRRLHPARPYDSPKVVVHNTDARAFLEQTDLQFDLIVFGTLDSMTRLSALSNVRLDNFVYTEESMAAAKARLSPTGGVVLMFMVGHKYIHDNLVGMLAHVFGEVPLTYLHYHLLFNEIFLVGPAFSHLNDVPEFRDSRRANDVASLGGPTDDWPYLYLQRPTVTPFYLSLIAIFAALAVGAVALASRHLRAGLMRGRVDVEMLLFGLAFLLLEARYVTEMNLVWGATWITSVVVFGSILLVVLAATLLTSVRALPFLPCLVGLFVALAVTWFLPTHALIGRHVGLRLALSIAYVGAPVFFASVCFALRFKQRAAADLAFGWNLLGAVLGGLLEIFSMALGLKALVLVAVVAYLGVALSVERSRVRAT